jgi:hypothetical protein
MFGKNFSRIKILFWSVGLLLILTRTNFLVAADRPGAVFLTIPPGARALGMGTAFTGSCNDPSSFYYNPGALALYNRFGLVVLNQGLPPGIGAGYSNKEYWLVQALFSMEKPYTLNHPGCRNYQICVMSTVHMQSL